MKIKKFKDWSIFSKILTISLITLVMISMRTIFYILPLIEKKMMNEKALKTRNLVEVVHSNIVNNAKKVESGEMTEEEAKKFVLAEINKMRYNEKDYFWVNDLSPKMIMHPMTPELNGKDLSDKKDPNGKMFFVEMANVAKNKGAGIVEYMWPKPNSTEAVPKISYVKLFKPWNWVIGSGIYVDDVKTEVGKIRSSVLMGLLGCCIVALLMAFFIAGMIVTPLKKAVVCADSLSRGDLEVDIDVDNHDETGQLLSSMKNMVKNLNDTADVAKKMSTGDFTVEVKPLSEKDVLGNSFLYMVNKLREIVVDVSNAIENIASSSEELSASSEELSQGAAEQASSAEEASSAMEEMSSNIQQCAHNALETEKIAIQAADEANEAGTAVTETVSAMKQVAGKISIISDISRQTNMLALNAAIEAARAGEHGKGFAVVAAEIRKLAERSQRAAVEISELSDSSIKVAETAGTLLTEMVPRIRKNAELVQEISAASNEQSTGALQINGAIQQLNQVVQQNADASEEIASSAGELSGQADNLRDVMSFFKLGEHAAVHYFREKSKDSFSRNQFVNYPGGNDKNLATVTKLVKPKSSKPANGIVLQMGNVDTKDMEFEKF